MWLVIFWVGPLRNTPLDIYTSEDLKPHTVGVLVSNHYLPIYSTFGWIIDT